MKPPDGDAGEASGFLQRAEVFGTLDPPLLAAIAPHLERVRVPEGGTAIREGEPADDCYAIIEGRASVITQVDGQTLELARLEPGDVFGEMSLFEQRPRSTSVIAVSALDLVRIPASACRTIEEKDPASAARFYRHLLIETSRRLRRANDVVTDFYRSRLGELERQRSEREFMDLLAHDLRSPLAIAETGVGQLVDRPDKYGPVTAAQQRVLKRSRRNMTFLRQLVEELVEVGRSNGGATRGELTNLEEIVLEAIPQSLVRIDGPTLDGIDDLADFEAVRRTLAPQGLAIEVPRELRRAPLRIDKMRVIQILMNLVGNALKYAPGAVTLRATREGGRLIGTVADRGPGIPEAFRTSVFERWRQADVRRAGIPRGFGLGLAGARELVTSLGGAIRAEPGEGGVGTCMTFEIPWKE